MGTRGGEVEAREDSSPLPPGLVPAPPSLPRAIFAFKNRNKVGASLQKTTFWTFSQHRAFPLSFFKVFLAAEMLPGRADPPQDERVSGSVARCGARPDGSAAGLPSTPTPCTPTHPQTPSHPAHPQTPLLCPQGGLPRWQLCEEQAAVRQLLRRRLVEHQQPCPPPFSFMRAADMHHLGSLRAQRDGFIHICETISTMR